MVLTVDQLLAVMPRLRRDEAAKFVPHIQDACDEFEINTPLRMAAFLAQIAHESGQLRYWSEFASGDAYEPPTLLALRLGNTKAGDGPKYKGRGPIQLTGRANYRMAGEALGVDLESNPKLVIDPEYGFRVAGWFWNRNKLNRLADVSGFDQITQRINGGQRGADERRRYYQKALLVLDRAA